MIAAVTLGLVAVFGGATLPPQPATDAVTLTLASPTLVLGVDQETELRVEISPELPPPAQPPRVLASVGHVDDLTATGPRSFTGRYVLPTERFPQAALLVAELPGAGVHVRGFTIVRLRAAASPAFHTDPGSAVTLRIGEKEFGPQTAPQDGNVRIPVVVPLGVTFGIARSTNRAGETVEQTVDLKIPPFRQMMVVTPETLAAGSVTEVAVYAVDTAGLPVDPSLISLRTSGGKPQPLGGRPGEARFLVRALPPVAAAVLNLWASLNASPPVSATVKLPLVAGPAARLTLRPDRGHLPIGVGSSMRVYLAAEDQFGNAADASDATVLVDGTPVTVSTTEEGEQMAIVNAPSRFTGRKHVEIEVALGSTYASEKIPLGNLPPRQGMMSTVVPRLTLTPRLGFVWSFRQPPGASLLLEALYRGDRWPQSLLIGMAVGLLALDQQVADSIGPSEISLRQIPVLALVRVQKALRRPLILAGHLGVGLTWVDARVVTYAREIPGQALAPTAEVGAETAVQTSNGHVVLGARYRLVTVGRLSSGDRLLGNAAGLIIDVGYRLAW